MDIFGSTVMRKAQNAKCANSCDARRHHRVSFSRSGLVGIEPKEVTNAGIVYSCYPEVNYVIERGHQQIKRRPAKWKEGIIGVLAQSSNSLLDNTSMHKCCLRTAEPLAWSRLMPHVNPSYRLWSEPASSWSQPMACESYTICSYKASVFSSANEDGFIAL